MSLSRARRSGISISTTPKKSRSLQDASGLPGPVQSITASATGVNTATLSWTQPTIVGDSAITSYSVTGGGSASVSGTSATITGLSPSTSYTFSISAVNSVGNGFFTPAPSITTSSFNAATGGTETTVSNYLSSGETWKVHTFNSTGTLSVTSAALPFNVLVVDGGLNGTGGNCSRGFPGGNGGRIRARTGETLPTGNISVVVGGGGGGASSVNTTLTSVGGTNGGTGGNSGSNPGGFNGGTGPLANTSGTSLRWSGGGGGGSDLAQAGNQCSSGGDRGGGFGGAAGGCGANGGSGTANTGGGGGGGGRECGYSSSGGNGGSGIAIIAYRTS